MICKRCQSEFVSDREHKSYCGECRQGLYFTNKCVICLNDFKTTLPKSQTCSSGCRKELRSRSLQSYYTTDEGEAKKIALRDQSNRVNCEVECATCHTIFISKVTYGTTSIYCPDCRRDGMFIHECPTCLEVFRSHDSGQIHCSQRCVPRIIPTSNTQLEQALRKQLDVLFPNQPIQTQYQIGPYSADFFLPLMELVVEADGDRFHSTDQQRAHDLKRDTYMQSLGLTVVRIRASEFKRNQLSYDLIQRFPVIPMLIGSHLVIDRTQPRF